MSRAKCDPIPRDPGPRPRPCPRWRPLTRSRSARSNWSRTSVRRAWSLEEDDAIRKLVADHGTKSWSRIAEALRTDFGIEERTGKQCRERWHNHLGPRRARTVHGPDPTPLLRLTSSHSLSFPQTPASTRRPGARRRSES